MNLTLTNLTLTSPTLMSPTLMSLNLNLTRTLNLMSLIGTL